MRTSTFACVAVAFLVVGCPVDERSLVPSSAGAAGSGSSGRSGTAGTAGSIGSSGETFAGGDGGEAGNVAGGSAGATAATAGTGGGAVGGSPGTAGSAGSAGSAGTAGTTTSGEGGAAGASVDYGAGGCGDLDHNDVQDCSETLLQNARFDSSVSDWQAGSISSQSWDMRNARNGQQSGALSVLNTTVAEAEGFILGGSEQCQPALGNTEFLLAARAFIPSGQGAGSASVNVWFFGADDCADYLLSSVGPDPVTATDKWLLVQGKVKSPPATRSMRVRLVVAKPYAKASFQALFDDVLVREQ